jgi:Ni/Co efflux regulator RcnB
MRKILISILLAGAAASPALAQDQARFHDRDNASAEQQERHQEREQVREQRNEAREQARSERSSGGGNFERSQQMRAQFEAQQQGQQQTQNNAEPRHVQRPGDVSRWTRENVQQTGETSRWTRDPNQRSGETSRWTRDRVPGPATGGDLRQPDRATPNVMRTRNPLVVSDTPREGTQPRLRTENHHWARTDWNGNWRNDHRYDWRHHRDRHRSIFHLGIYYDPFGWNYRPYQIGWRLWPSYYGSRYWINDPYQYRLPYAPPGTVWIRYYDDALLVDQYTGEVIDVIHNFFW